MDYPTKEGGGKKQQPYIPAGHGDESGEYTNKSAAPDDKSPPVVPQPYCNIKNKRGLFNPKKSKLVGKVNLIYSFSWGHTIPTTFKPNSVIKKIVYGKIEQERYYNEKGEVYLEIHYTNHGNPKVHPKVPHIHRSKTIKGTYYHGPWEDFQ